MTAVKSVYVRCAMAHRLISLSSIGQWLIVSIRLGTQAIQYRMVYVLHCIYLLLLVLSPTSSASQSVNDILITVNQSACRCTPTLFVEIQISCSRSYFCQETEYLLSIIYICFLYLQSCPMRHLILSVIFVVHVQVNRAMMS